MNIYKLSIIIPVFNKLNFTKSCLRDLLQLTSDNQIIIINNNSSDGTKEYLDEVSKITNVVIIHLDENLGFAKACNIGYVSAQSDTVLFLNNDIRVKSGHENWTNILIESCASGLCGPTMGLLDKNLNFKREANAQLKGNSYLSGWCLAGKKETLNKLIIKDYQGPFSEETFCYFEDTDLSFRARRDGIALKVVPVPVVHFGKQSSAQLNTALLFTKAKKIFLKNWSNKKV